MVEFYYGDHPNPREREGPIMTDQELDNYEIDLAEELELRDVPPEVVERIVRDVRSHSAESGEDPFDSFGSPTRYADEFAPRSWTRRMLVPIVLVAALLGAGAAFMIISGIFGFISSSAELWGLAPGTRLIMGGLFLGGFIGLLTTLTIRSRQRSAAWKHE